MTKDKKSDYRCIGAEDIIWSILKEYDVELGGPSNAERFVKIMRIIHGPQEENRYEDLDIGRAIKPSGRKDLNFKDPIKFKDYDDIYIRMAIGINIKLFANPTDAARRYVHALEYTGTERNAVKRLQQLYSKDGERYTDFNERQRYYKKLYYDGRRKLNDPADDDISEIIDLYQSSYEKIIAVLKENGWDIEQVPESIRNLIIAQNGPA